MELDLPLHIRCENCNGQGEIYLQGFDLNEKMNFCREAGFHLKALSTCKAICNKCKGSGVFDLEEIKLEGLR